MELVEALTTYVIIENRYVYILEGILIENEGKPFVYWNYFIALEEDLVTASRYIEFSNVIEDGKEKNNEKTFSVELAKLLLSACSEVDVVLKELCKLYDPNFDSDRPNIDDYRRTVIQHNPEFSNEKVYLRRHSRILNPWVNWENDKNPFWWTGYNDVKHHRADKFSKAKLNFVLNAMAGLLIVVFFYYKETLLPLPEYANEIDILNKLRPESQLLFLNEDYYPRRLILN